MSSIRSVRCPGAARLIPKSGSQRPAALFNQIFLNVYDGGQAYTESQHRDWLTEAGFGDFKHEVQAMIPA